MEGLLQNIDAPRGVLTTWEAALALVLWNLGVATFDPPFCTPFAHFCLVCPAKHLFLTRTHLRLRARHPAKFLSAAALRGAESSGSSQNGKNDLCFIRLDRAVSELLRVAIQLDSLRGSKLHPELVLSLCRVDSASERAQSWGNVIRRRCSRASPCSPQLVVVAASVRAGWRWRRAQWSISSVDPDPRETTFAVSSHHHERHQRYNQVFPRLAETRRKTHPLSPSDGTGRNATSTQAQLYTARCPASSESRPHIPTTYDVSRVGRFLPKCGRRKHDSQSPFSRRDGTGGGIRERAEVDTPALTCCCRTAAGRAREMELWAVFGVGPRKAVGAVGRRCVWGGHAGRGRIWALDVVPGTSFRALSLALRVNGPLLGIRCVVRGKLRRQA
uniref:Uncharacterized protein n=1 Tax=Mycena chlorophos TaxID=658473 RepID=A0ABQ0LJ73_MYCCL|nr:predicted protein [Mycena chlorophos]